MSEFESISEGLERGLKSAVWLSSVDASAVGSARRLARLLDALLDANDTKDLSQLLARYFQLLAALRLTPESRSEQSKANDDSTTSLDTIQDSYARLIAPKDRVAKAKRSHPSAGRK